MGLDHKVFNFFKNYLVGRKTQYCWNDFISPSFNINVGVGQGSALSPILSALYLSPIFHSLEKCLKSLKIPISLISFVDNGLLVSQNKSILHSNTNLFCSYNIMSSLLSKFGLIIKYSKTDVFHFSRAHGVFNPLSLDLSSIRDPVLLPKDIWRYLGFIFDCKLIFRNYIDFTPTKWFLLSNVWSCSVILPEASTLYKNNDSTDVVHYPLCIMDFYYGITTKHPCITISIS